MAWEPGAYEYDPFWGGLPGGGVEEPPPVVDGTPPPDSPPAAPPPDEDDPTPTPEPEPTPTPPPGPAPGSGGPIVASPRLHFRDTYDILGAASIKGSRSGLAITSKAPEETFNTVDYRYAPNFATNEFAGIEQYINESDLAEVRAEERTQVDLMFARDPATARWAARTRAIFFNQRSYETEFYLDAPRNIDRIDVGDVIGLTYYGGIGGPWINEPFLVTAIRYEMDALRYLIRAKRLIVSEDLEEQVSDTVIGRWTANSRIGPFFESGARRISIVLKDTRGTGKNLVVLTSSDLGGTFEPAGEGPPLPAIFFDELANGIGSHDVHRVGNILHVATQEAVTGRVAYHRYDLLLQQWTIFNELVLLGNSHGDCGVSITVLSDGQVLVWYQADRAIITNTDWPGDPGAYKRSARKRRSDISFGSFTFAWSFAIDIGDPGSAASNFTGPHPYNGKVHQNVGRVVAGRSNRAHYIYGRDEPLDVASTKDFQIQTENSDGSLGANIDFQFTGLLGYSAQFIAGDYATFVLPSEGEEEVVPPPDTDCGCASCQTEAPPQESTGGDLWLAVPIGWGMSPVVFAWKDADNLSSADRFMNLSSTVVPAHVFEAAYPAIALRYIQGRLHAVFGDVGIPDSRAVHKVVSPDPLNEGNVDPSWSLFPHDNQVGPTYDAPFYIQMIGLEMAEIDGTLWMFHVSTAGGPGFHFESHRLN